MKKTTLDLSVLDPKTLPELVGWEEKQLAVVKENPFVEIVDTETYNTAKKHRTALVTARTDIEKQDKLIAAKLKTFRSLVNESSQELIEITINAEIKQQEEVKRFEAEKEAEKERLIEEERERVQKIKDHLDGLETEFKEIVANMTFARIDIAKEMVEAEIENQSEFDFAEFELLFDKLCEDARINWLEHKIYWEKTESQRLENERLKKVAEKAEEEARIAREELKKKTDAILAKQKKDAKIQAKKDADAKAKNDALQAKLDAIEEEREAERNEKARLAHNEKVKKESELKKAEQKKAENLRLKENKKHQARLSTDKKRMLLYLESWTNEVDADFENKEMKDLFLEYSLRFLELGTEFNTKIINL